MIYYSIDNKKEMQEQSCKKKMSQGVYIAPEAEVLELRGLSILDDLSLYGSFDEFIEGEEF